VTASWLRAVCRCLVLLACCLTAGIAQEVDTLLESPRQHPYLFFDRDGAERLREMAATEPWSQAAELIIRSAEGAISADIPPEPDEGPDQPRDEDGNYTAYYLRIHYEFYDAGHAINEIVPTLAMAWVLTGEQRFADRAREWMLHYAGWKQWSVKSALADNQSAHSYLGLAIGYDWLYDELSDAERATILGALGRLGETFQTHRGGLADQPLAGRRGGIANNHTWVSHSAPALGALAQLYEQPAAREWLETEIICWRDKILPASIGRDGEYIDGSGGWLTYCLQNGLLFLAAMRRNGCDLYEGSNLDSVAHFIMCDRELLAEGASVPPYDVRYSFLELASRYQDPATQWAALANGLALSVSAHSRRWPGSESTSAPPYEADTWYSVRLEWDADTQHFRTTIDGELREDMPMLDREFDSIDRLAFMGHWRTDCVVDIRGLRVLDLSAEPADAVLALSDLPTGRLDAGEGIDIQPPEGAVADIIAGDEPTLRFTDATDDQAGILSFSLSPLRRGAIEFELRKADNDSSYFYLRTWDATHETRGIIWYIDGTVKKHMPDYKNQDYPFGWRPGGGPWYPSVFEFLFYDPEVIPQRPEAGQPSVAFRDLGWVKMRSDWSPDAVRVFFRSGPEMGKDHGNNHAFLLSAFGEDILPDLPTPPSGESELTQKQYDLYAWFQGTQAQNTILPGEHTQPAVWGDQTGRQYGAQWLAEPGEGITPRGRLTDALFTDACDYASGEAAAAYTRDEPVLRHFRRDIMFIKPDAVLVYDELEAAAEPLLYKWLLHARRPISVEDDPLASAGRMVVRGEKAIVHATPLFPTDARIDILTTPAPLEQDRTRYFSLHAPEPTGHQRFLVFLQPVRAGAAEPLVALRRAEGTNCLGVVSERGEVTDRAIFVESESGYGEVAGCAVRGRAAWVRGPEGAVPLEYALQAGTELSFDGQTLARLSATGSVGVTLDGDDSGPSRFEVVGSLSTDGTVEVRLPARPSRLWVDDQHQDAFEYADGLLRLALPAGDWRARGEF